MYRLLYSVLWYLLCPFIILRLLIRSRRNPEYRNNWLQRFGHVQCEHRPRIWLHAVSVGETIAAKPLVHRLLEQYPEHSLLVSNTTPTGSATAKRLFGSHVEHSLCPYDLPQAVSSFLDRTRPALLVIMETEIWPNLLHQCQQRNIPIVIANARLSERSTSGYSKISGLISPALQSISTIACRSEQDAHNFRQIGACDEQVQVCGNIKFDVINDSASNSPPLLQTSRKVWVAASTHDGEDAIILSLFKQLQLTHPDVLLILVPRHPERFDDVYKLCLEQELITQKRSTGIDMTGNIEVVIGDSMGEMSRWYAIADVVFIGGSLVKTGGHNPLEATVFGVPVISGPHTFNFSDVFGVLIQNKLAWVEDNEVYLLKRLIKLLNLPEDSLELFQQQATTVLKNNSGVAKKLTTIIHEALPS